MGNRYEYSGVNVSVTYVYSQNYVFLLNGVSLLIFLNGPFILGLVLLNWRMQHKGNGYNPAFLMESGSMRSEWLTFLQIANLKYLGLLMLGLISAIWNTMLNN